MGCDPWVSPHISGWYFSEVPVIVNTFDLWKYWKDGSISLTREGKKEDVLLLPSLNGFRTFMWLGERGYLREKAKELYNSLKEKEQKISSHSDCGGCDSGCSSD
jgi:hypothetical protein